MQSYLHHRTLEKMFREHFGESAPITIPTESGKVELLTELKTQLSARSGFNVLENLRFRKHELAWYFQVISSSVHFHNQLFLVTFNDEDELVVSSNWKQTTVSQLEQIYSLFDRMSLEYARLHKYREKYQKEVIKREKIKDLKHTAILATIHEIARQEKFEFRIKEYVNRVKFIIRLTEAEQIEIDIQYHKFQDTLKMLRDTIQQIGTDYELGPSFKVRSYVHEKDPQWIRYD